MQVEPQGNVVIPAELCQAIGGAPGEQRTPVVEREQKPLTVKAPVVRVL